MRVRFGRFVFDPETRELLRGDVRVPLSPKAFDLLSLLIAHRPKAMAKNELQERLWPTTFVVEKNRRRSIQPAFHSDRPPVWRRLS